MGVLSLTTQLPKLWGWGSFDASLWRVKVWASTGLQGLVGFVLGAFSGAIRCWAGRRLGVGVAGRWVGLCFGGAALAVGLFGVWAVVCGFVARAVAAGAAWLGCGGSTRGLVARFGWFVVLPAQIWGGFSGLVTVCLCRRPEAVDWLKV